jgi:hypothetical protein
LYQIYQAVCDMYSECKTNHYIIWVIGNKYFKNMAGSKYLGSELGCLRFWHCWRFRSSDYNHICEFWSFHGGVSEDSILLGYDMMSYPRRTESLESQSHRT